MKPELISLQARGDSRGSLVAIEDHKNVPFDIKRVYYVYGTKEGVSRGFHAHRELRQMVIPLSGSCDFLLDDGKTVVTVALKDPTVGLMVEKMVWHEMHNFSNDCILLVLASAHYDEADYIRDYDEFKKLIGAKL